jgi:TolB-like protein
MKTILKLSLLFLTLTVIIGGCSRNQIVRAPDLPSSVTDITEEITRRADNHKTITDQTIILTSMVDVDDMRQSSDFGRLFSDSLMTNLERFGWRVIDYRGVEVIAKVKGGEFYLDRSKLKQFGDNYLVVVGTYGEYDESLLVNVRVLDHTTNELVVSSNVLIEDEETLKLAQVDNCKDLTCKSSFNMKIMEDDCAVTGRCKDVECESGNCGTSK